MKDLRLGEDVRKLVDAGVVSLKIEGRMKSSLYVAAVTRYYREILEKCSNNRMIECSNETCSNEKSSNGRVARPTSHVPGSRPVTVADLETIFSRRTTELYLNCGALGATRPTTQPPNHPTTQLPNHLTTQRPNDLTSSSPIDPDSLGHRGAPIGTVKHVTKDREGRSWLRFHTARALEVHDGLQFDTMLAGRHLGFGIREMRSAISRTPVFEVAAGTDVEVLLPEGEGDDAFPVQPGETVYCSMSNAVKRMFPAPHYRPSDYPGTHAVDLEVAIAADAITARAGAVEASVPGAFGPAKNPEKTHDAVVRAFSKLGETDYALGRLTLVDPDRRFAPMSVLNDLRRDLVERLDEAREKARQAKVAAARDITQPPDSGALGATRPTIQPPNHLSTQRPNHPARTLKIRADQSVPAGDWDEIVVALDSFPPSFDYSNIRSFDNSPLVRLALPVYTAEPDFGRLRVLVKRLRRAGYEKWEASDLATLRMLKACGIEDITADWTLYAFNSSALAELTELGVRRFVASPENARANLQYLAESGYAVEFLAQQATPLFVSLTRPAAETVSGLAIYRRGNLWVTTRPVPRTFDPPAGAPTRLDLSWTGVGE